MTSLWKRICMATLSLAVGLGVATAPSESSALETLPITQQSAASMVTAAAADDSVFDVNASAADAELPATDAMHAADAAIDTNTPETEADPAADAADADGPAPESPEDTGLPLPDADNRPPVGSEVFIAYVYATERVAAWTDYALAIAQAAKNTKVLSRFGLATVDEVKAIQAASKAALDELSKQKLLQEAAAQQLGTYTGTGGQPEEALSAAPELAAQLKLALRSERTAARALQHAQLGLRSGTTSSAEVDAQQLIYLQARLGVIDAKLVYCQSILAAYTASGGEAMRLTAFLQTLSQQAEIADLAEWQTLLDTYVIRPYSRADAEQVPSRAPRAVEQEGEIFVPLRPYAEALHYQLEWVPEESRVLLTKDQQTISVTWHEPQVLIDDRAYSLSSAPYASGGHTYVPLTLFSSVLGLEVHWIEQEEQAMIIPGIGEVGLP